jgi:hypothetical protein
MELKHADVAEGRLELSLAISERVSAGLMAACGGGFAAIAMRFLRAPVPPIFKALPLAFLAVGAGVGTLGALNATAEFVILVERGQGVTFRWRRGSKRREIRVPDSEIEAFAIAHHASHHGASTSTEWPHANHDWVEVQFRLVLVTKSGEAYPIETFALREQAVIRRRLIETVLR